MEVIKSTLAAGAKPFQIRQSNCDVPKHFTPLRMAGDYLGAIALILLTGILAGLTLAVMSVDLARLVVWTKTGRERQRKNAAKILEVRNRPDWLLTSLILASVMVAEGLPLVLNQLLPSDAIWVSFLVSTTAVALFGEIIPQTVMPLYTLEISGRCMWFVKTVMYLNAIPAFIPAYALRKFRYWRKRKEPYKMDGIMDMDELMEFVRLHEQSECHGGQLLDEAGTLVRTVMEHQKVPIFEVIRPWTCALLLETTSWITPAVVSKMKNCNDAYAIVIVREVGIDHARSVFEENEGREPQIPSLSAQLAGILLAKDFICLDVQHNACPVASLPIRPIPFIQENCSIHRALRFLTKENYPCAFVVSSLDKILSQDLIDITPSLGDLGSISLEAVSPLGIVDYHDLVFRVLCGQTPSYTPNGIIELSRFSETQAPTVPIDNNAILSGGGGRCRYRVNEGSSSNPVPAHLRSASLDNGVSLRNNQVSRYGGSTSGYTRKPRGSIWGCYGPEQMRWQKGRKTFEGLERDFNESK